MGVAGRSREEPGGGGGVLSCPRCVARASFISMVYDQTGRPGPAPYNPHVLHQGAHSSTDSIHCYCVFIALVYTVRSVDPFTG